MRYLTNELAKLLGVTTNTIRRYEDSGFLKPTRDKANYRYYQKFDIIKLAMIRLFIKCGFSHDAIRYMQGNTRDNIRNICAEKLNEIDGQLERLKKLRHWLKDNIQLMDTVEELDGKFFIMDCPALRYVTYCVGDEVQAEKERLKTINFFMYEAPEVQLINIFRYDDLKEQRFIPYSGWAVKEIDIEKFHMENMIKTNKYIEYYPKVKSLYGVIRMPHKDAYDENKLNAARSEFLKKAGKYIDENNYKIIGDVVEILVNVLGDVMSLLIYLPIEEKNEVII